MKSSPAAPAPTSAGDKPSDLTRNIVSLLLFVHIFCVAVALWGNFQRSSIESRLLEVLAPYLRTLNLDPDFTRFYLVHGSQSDDDRFFEVEIVPEDAPGGKAADSPPASEAASGKIVALPESGIRGGLARRRYFALSYVMGFYANPDVDNETVTGELAKAIGGAVLREEGATRGVVRCKHHMSQPRELRRLVAGFPADPHAPQYAVTEYEADVWFDDQGQVQVNPRIAALETAAVEQGAKETSGASQANNASSTQPATAPSTSSGRPSPGGGASRAAQKRAQAAAAASAPTPETITPDPRAKSYPFRPLPGKPLPGQPRARDDGASTGDAGSTTP
jgi:hypothetical protein